jgi:hypothetical protein
MYGIIPVLEVEMKAKKEFSKTDLVNFMLGVRYDFVLEAAKLADRKSILKAVKSDIERCSAIIRLIRSK